MTRSAFDFAHFFIKRGLDEPRNTKKGNMKLQKLLYFSQLVSLSEFSKPLFRDKIYAYENGCIVDSVMTQYHRNHDQLIGMSLSSNVQLTSEEEFTVKLVESVYGNLSAEELSELNHEHSCWRLAYGRSYISPNYRDKYSSEINYDEVSNYDLEGIKKIVNGYKSSGDDQAEELVIIGGTEFYFDPREITMNEEIRSYLEKFVGVEEAFTVYFDSSQGIVVY